LKKKTLNAVLLAFNICLACVIVLLITLIIKRGPKPMEQYAASDNQTIAEQMAAEQEGEDGVPAQQMETQQTTSSVLVCIPTDASSVNVRTGPSTDYQRIGSAYMENNYDVVAILDNGWTKIIYDGQTGYISSDYVRYQMKTIYNGNEENVSFIDASEEEINEYRKSDDNAPAPPVIEETQTEIPADTAADTGAAIVENADDAVANIIADQEANTED